MIPVLQLMMGDRYRDGMTLDWALLRNWGTLPLVLRESYKSRRDKTNTDLPAVRQVQRIRGRSARSSDDTLGNLSGAKGLTYQGCQIRSTCKFYLWG